MPSSLRPSASSAVPGGGGRPSRRTSSGAPPCACPWAGGEPDRDTAVLGSAALGDVEPAHDLQAADDRACMTVGIWHLARDTVDAGTDDHLLGCGSKWMSEASSSIARDSTEWTSLIAGALVAATSRTSVSSSSSSVTPSSAPCRTRRGRACRACARGRSGRRRRTRRSADREPQVVGGEHVGRVGDGDEHLVLAEDRTGTARSAGEALGQEARGRVLDLGRHEVDELAVMLLGKRLGEVGARYPAVIHHDLPEPLACLRLLGERLFELLGRQDTLAHQERAELRPALGPAVRVRGTRTAESTQLPRPVYRP